MNLPDLKTPFGDLTVRLWDNQVVLIGVVTVNTVEYSARVEFGFTEGGQWILPNYNHLQLDRRDHKSNTPFPFKAREKFSQTVLELWKKTVTKENMAHAREEKEQQEIKSLLSEIDGMKAKLKEKTEELIRVQMAREKRGLPSVQRDENG